MTAPNESKATTVQRATGWSDAVVERFMKYYKSTARDWSKTYHISSRDAFVKIALADGYGSRFENDCDEERAMSIYSKMHSNIIAKTAKIARRAIYKEEGIDYEE